MSYFKGTTPQISFIILIQKEQFSQIFYLITFSNTILYFLK